MRNRIIKQATWTIVITVTLSLVAGMARAQEFRAKITRTMNGETQNGEVYVKGGKTWTDLGPPRMGMGGSPGGKVFVITDKDQGKVFMVNADEKSYSEMPMRGMMDPNAAAKMVEQMGGKMTEGGMEMVAGYKCKKVTYAFPDKNMGQTTLWQAVDLGDYTLKTVMENPFMSMTVEVQDIRRARVSDSKFLVPAGYKKVERSPGQRQGRGRRPRADSGK